MADSQHTDESNYGYTPSAAWCLVFIVLFSLSGCAYRSLIRAFFSGQRAIGDWWPAVLHCFQAWRSKYWIVYPTLVLGALTEVLGWSARYWSSQNVLLLTPFLMQISTWAWTLSPPPPYQSYRPEAQLRLHLPVVAPFAAAADPSPLNRLIIAPVFFSAYCYAVLGTAIHKLGAQYSILRANWVSRAPMASYLYLLTLFAS
jgi:hypothetical protein